MLADPPCKENPDLGKIVERSISQNERTRRAFLNEIKKQSGEQGLGNRFAFMEDVQVETFEAQNEKEERFHITYARNHAFCAVLSPLVWSLAMCYLCLYRFL